MEISIQSNTLSATLSTLGAELISLNADNKELIWQGKGEFWQGNAPILFPICGFLKNGQYSYDNEDYAMPVHGFADKCTFELVKESDTSVTFLLTDTQETRNQYPFSFELRVTYTIEHKCLSVFFEVKNTGTQTLPFSLGWHPGFNIHYPAKLSFDKNSCARRRQVAQSGLIGPAVPYIMNSLELEQTTFANGGIVLQESNTKEVILECADYSIRLENSQFPNLVLWGQPTADFICLEPWHGMGDHLEGHIDLRNKEDIILLAEADTWSAKASLGIGL